jgi:hypothetical protein
MKRWLAVPLVGLTLACTNCVDSYAPVRSHCLKQSFPLVKEINGKLYCYDPGREMSQLVETESRDGVHYPVIRKSE